MKILVFFGLLILTSCQAVTPELSPTPTPTNPPPTPSQVPPTLTPTLTPSPTITPQPPPRTFTEEFEDPPLHWSTLQASGEPDSVSTLNEAGKLTFEITGPNVWMYALYGPHEYETVRVETSVASSGSDTNYMGLVCHYDEQEGWYEFNISSDGKYNALHGRWLGQGIASYTPLAEGNAGSINPGKASNLVRLDCDGDMLGLYINGALFRTIDVSRFGLARGKVGLSIASFEETPVILSFDWVEVSQP